MLIYYVVQRIITREKKDCTHAVQTQVIPDLTQSTQQQQQNIFLATLMMAQFKP